MATGEYKYAVNQHAKSFHDKPSKEFFLKLTMMSATCPECDMEFSRKDALLSHIRNRHETTQPYPQSIDAYPPSSQAYPLTPPILRGGLPIYRLKDFHDEEIKGTFYQSELQKVDVRDDDIWTIEKILKTNGTGNNKHYFIKWLHWPKKFNSWISARDVNNH
jgi:hypothetical protein